MTNKFVHSHQDLYEVNVNILLYHKTHFSICYFSVLQLPKQYMSATIISRISNYSRCQRQLRIVDIEMRQFCYVNAKLTFAFAGTRRDLHGPVFDSQ